MVAGTVDKAAVPTEQPNRLLVLGGGVVGIELAQGFARLGSKVTVIEAGPSFLGLEEPEAGAALLPHLKADGIEFFIGDPCVAVEGQAADVVVHLKSGALVAGDRLLVATGRRPNFEAWKQSGLVQTDRGWLKVDRDVAQRDGVYGARDITGIGGSRTRRTTTARSSRAPAPARTRGPQGDPARDLHRPRGRVRRLVGAGGARAWGRTPSSPGPILPRPSAVTSPTSTAVMKLVGDRAKGRLWGDPGHATRRRDPGELVSP
jgi:NADPH-dependent 2,4-dienoyl-CoA reductase/sulfur reductase-like enzyme